jgi:prepilin-type N-terminal cleavage/methylation domain-containing protein
MKNPKKTDGFSLIELLFVVAILSLVMAAMYVSYSKLLREGVGQYRVAESEMEHGIVKNIVERDMAMAGFGIMESYDYNGDGVQEFTAKAVTATDGTGYNGSDTFTLLGTALGIESRAAQGWALVTGVTGTPPVPTFLTQTDVRETLRQDDRIVMMDIANRQMLGDSTGWLFRYKDTTSNVVHATGDTEYEKEAFTGMTLYGISSSGTTTATQPYYAVSYYLSDSSVPSRCAPGTANLLRAESRTSSSPTGGNPIMNCVRDFQVAFGLNSDEDEFGTIDVWDNGGVTAGGYEPSEVNKRLKQMRAYVLVQVGGRDENYTYSNPDPNFAADTIRIGDLALIGGATGRPVTLNADQRKYRWRVVTFTVTPRNLR